MPNSPVSTPVGRKEENVINLANTDSGGEREESKNEGESKMEGRKLFGDEMAGGRRRGGCHTFRRGSLGGGWRFEAGTCCQDETRPRGTMDHRRGVECRF